MDAVTWTTVSRLLDEALDQPPEARAAWLERLPAEYDTVKPRLAALLTNASSMDRASFLATLPKFGAGDGAAEAPAAPARDGALVGPYRLVRVIASGGQGSVWLAERADGLLARPVAVKLPHGLAFRPGLAERMARERDILAGLTHPNIARLYDAGVTAAGEPFLALEYVEGVPIDQYAAERQLDTAARVRLFQQVIAAVAFAHGRLVIHRDLKPSNILVTAEGDVRLLDFGIAKLLGDEAVDSTLTIEAGRAMTLAYASPEQVGQQTLGVASDVYSLGVVLYELLAGVRPYVLARESAAALEDAVLTQEPRRASEAASGVVRRALAGDLDTMLAKALKKDPAARYATAAAFGDDLARWLDGRPVVARPDSRAYRMRKFVGRHRVAVLATAAAMAAIVAGAGAAVWQAGIARQEQRRAEDVKEFIASILRDTNPDAAAGQPVALLDLLTRADARLRSLPSGPVKAELFIVLGEGLLGLGDTRHLDGVAASAVEESATAGDPSLQLRAHVLQAQALFYGGDPAAMSAALDRADAVLAASPEASGVSRGTLLRLRADAHLRAGRYADAVQAARESLAATELAGGTPREVLQALMIVADAEHQARHPAEAVAAAERAHAIVEREFASSPGHPFALRTRALYADALADRGDLRRAVDLMEQVTRDSEAVFGASGRTVAFRLQRLAQLQMRLGRAEAAVANARRALGIMEAGTDSAATPVAAFHNALGTALVAVHRGGEAVSHFERAIGAAIRMFGPTHDNTLNSRAMRAWALVQAGRRGEAHREIDEVMAAMQASGRELGRSLLVAGVVRRAAGDPAGAIAVLERAVAALEADQPLLWQAHAQRGWVLLEQGAVDAAAAALEQAVALIDRLGLDDPPDAIDAVDGLARAYRAAGRDGDARRLAARAAAARRAASPSVRTKSAVAS